jgi:hypothetical protein
MRARNSDKYELINKATYGIVFFGTPHGGGNYARFGDVVARIAGALRPSNSFMHALKKSDFYAEQNRDDFLQRAKDFAFLTFFETIPMNGVMVRSSSHHLTTLHESATTCFPTQSVF